MKKILLVAVILLLFSSNSSVIFANSASSLITDYQAIFIPYANSQGQLAIALRMFSRDKGTFFLVVNPYTFKTSIDKAENINFRRPTTPDKPGYIKAKEVYDTPYVQALTRYTGLPYPLQNGGAIRAEHSVSGMFLTIDMCPSSKPFEQQFYQQLVTLAEQNNQPLPIAISISGLWLLKHEQEFGWLQQQQQHDKLAITWINHSFSHLYYPDRPLAHNFLLMSQTHFKPELLATEKLLLEHGQLPSVFFRYPGLVADKKLMLQLRKYGLIPIGSDAWLAKGQWPKAGSFILVHGNSNEHRGMVLIMSILPKLKLLPLALAFNTTELHK
jgi:hypothetical protein